MFGLPLQALRPQVRLSYLTLGKENSRSQDAEPQSKLETGNQRHASVVVLLDETTKGVAQSGGLRLLASWGDWRWLDSREDDGAGVGQNVEGAVDGKWEEGERVLLREEPDEGHGWEGKFGQH